MDQYEAGILVPTDSLPTNIVTKIKDRILNYIYQVFIVYNIYLNKLILFMLGIFQNWKMPFQYLFSFFFPPNTFGYKLCVGK